MNYINVNIKRLTYIASAINKSLTQILISENTVGSYYENKILLPEIIVSNKKTDVSSIYIYIILFFAISKKLNFYLNDKKNNLDYILLSTILTVKPVQKIIKKKYNEINKYIEKCSTYFFEKRKNILNLKERELLFEIIIKKLMHQRIKNKINLNKNDKQWIYKIENEININQYNLIKKTDELYLNLIKIQKKYYNLEYNILWGYLSENKNNKKHKCLKNKIKINNDTKSIDLNNITKLIQKKTFIKKKEEYLLNQIFDYKKTIDKYKNQKNKNTDNNLNNDIDIQKTLQSENKIIQYTNNNDTYGINKNNITFLQTDITTTKYKKINYKEWDYKLNVYKKNWCNLFIQNYESKLILNTNKINIENIIKKNKIYIKNLQKTLDLFVNKKEWLNKQQNGHDIDIDNIIDNYKYIKENNFNKIYKYKKLIKKDVAFCILLDSSLSTDSFIKNIKIIDILKTILLIIACGFNKIINKFCISTFYSNTRNDCKYIILKDFNENWNKCKYKISNINPIGYTRIGPILRHSIEKLNKIKAKEKKIILLSDGKPTDYDEYEGNYGINDIKKIFTESEKKNIKIKIILPNKNLIFEKTNNKVIYCINNFKDINKILKNVFYT